MLSLLAAALQIAGNPFNTAADVESGRALFLQHCTVCHGIDASGGRGTDLTKGVYKRGSADEDLFRTVQGGIPGTEMPPSPLDGRQMWQMIAYLRTVSAPRSEKAIANPARGRAVFEGKGDCLKCHAVNGRGSRVGPELSTAGRNASRVSLESSLLRPDERVVPAHWQVRAVTRDGRTVTGTRLNEDTFSIQVLDWAERLVSLHKPSLRELEIIKRGLMPSYEGKLSRDELDDLISYLMTLQ